jgi:periplasmic protein TonB
MREPALGFDSNLSSQSSLLKRIRENLLSVWTLPRVVLAARHAANGAPIHLLEDRRRKPTLTAQAGSTCLHALIFAALVYSMTHPLVTARPGSKTESFPVGSLNFSAPKWMREAAMDSPGRRGNGGDLNPLPPTAGELAPPSRLVFAPPRLPDGRPHPLSVPITTFDPDAPDLASPVKDLGLPWMRDPNNSAGPGTDGIGTRPGRGMGDGPGDGSGQGDDATPYNRVATQVICKICPDPGYSDEARKAKLQGLVTMHVLVGADGRVRDVQITRGIGLGLDENAVRAVRSWQFIPARDGARRPVATWITIETVFRLF